MAANTDPIFTLTPIITSGSLSIANTSKDGTGSIETVATGALYGTRVHKITIKSSGSTSAGMVRLYIDNTSSVRLWREFVVTAITPGASTATYENIIILSGESALVLPNGYKLRASTHNGELFTVFAEGGDF